MWLCGISLSGWLLRRGAQRKQREEREEREERFSILTVVDTEGYMGEAEGGTELITNCTDGDVIQWRIVGIRPDVSVSMANFIGSAISQYHIIKLQQVTAVTEPYWTSRVELTNNEPTLYQYTFDIVINNMHYSFDPYLEVASA